MDHEKKISGRSLEEIKEGLNEWRFTHVFELLNNREVLLLLDLFIGSYRSLEKLKGFNRIDYLYNHYIELIQMLAAEIIEKIGNVEGYLDKLLETFDDNGFKSIDYKFPKDDIKFYKILLEEYALDRITRTELVKQIVHERYRIILELIEKNE